MIARVGDQATPYLRIMAIYWHAIEDKIALVLSEIATSCMRVWMLKHGIVIVLVNASSVRVRCDRVLLLLLSALEHAREVVRGGSGVRRCWL